MEATITAGDIVWLKTATVAGRLGYAAETIVDWVKAGRIPEACFRKMPKGYRFHKNWVADPVLLP